MKLRNTISKLQADTRDQNEGKKATIRFWKCHFQPKVCCRLKQAVNYFFCFFNSLHQSHGHLKTADNGSVVYHLGPALNFEHQTNNNNLSVGCRRPMCSGCVRYKIFTNTVFLDKNVTAIRDVTCHNGITLLRATRHK